MELEIGAILEGKVTGITKFGAFVSLPGGRSGLVHISEVAYSFVNDVSDFLTVGQDVKVKIIGIDPNNRINLSIKQTLPPPPRQERAPRQGGGHRGGGYQPRENHGGERSEHYGERRGNDRPRGNGGRPSRPAGGTSRSSASREPLSFEDMMKQYMSESETKLSQLNRGERSRGRRRGRGGSGNGGNF